jgi:hypothetical protein
LRERSNQFVSVHFPKGRSFRGTRGRCPPFCGHVGCTAGYRRAHRREIKTPSSTANIVARRLPVGAKLLRFFGRCANWSAPTATSNLQSRTNYHQASDTLRRDCRNAKPRPAKPRSIMAQVEGSGTPLTAGWFEVAGGPDAQRLVLEFPLRSASGERLDPVRQIIACYWQRAHYGGRYLIFLCSECDRRRLPRPKLALRL